MITSIAWTKKTGLSYAIIRTIAGVSEPLYCGADVYEAAKEFDRYKKNFSSGEVELIDSDGDWLERVSR